MNFAHWMTVPERNAVAAGFRLARECVGLVVAGDWPVAWLSGPGGIGKTVITKTAIKTWQEKGLDDRSPSIEQENGGLKRKWPRPSSIVEAARLPMVDLISIETPRAP